MDVRRILGRESGSTLVIVALLMAAVATLSLSFLAVLRSSQQESEGSRENLSALYACEAGLTAAVEQLTRGGTGAIGNKYQPQEYGEQSYYVQATPMSDGRTALVSVGRDDDARMAVEMVVQRRPSGFFRWAAFGDEWVHMDSNSRTDSYESDAGTYLSQQVNGSGSNAHANSEGDVASNGNISMDSNIGVYGDANPGPGGVVTGDLGNISGATTPMPNSVDLPDVIVPSIPNTGNKTVTLNESLSSGSYHFNTLQINNNKTLTVNGPATIVCENMKLKASSNLVVNASSGPVEFFIVNDFVMNSGTTISSTSKSPLDVSFSLLSDNVLDPGVDINFDEDLVDFDSNAVLYGTIFAPSAEVTIDSNFELFGALVARRVDLDSNCRIHYDEVLATVDDGGEATYETLCWRVVTQP